MSENLVKTHVVVSRNWHSPAITVALHRERPGLIGGMIALGMTAEDFVKALTAEVASDRLTLRTSTFEARMLAAADRVIAEIKQASATDG